MRFRTFLLNEQDPMGGGMAPPGGAGAPPAAGGDPMADPMAGGMDPMGGAPPEDAPAGADPVPVPMHGDVWDVLYAILNNKEIEEPKPPQAPLTGADPMGGGMGMDPMMGGGMDPMGGGGGMGMDPMMGGGMDPMGGAGGGGGPFLQG